MRLFRRLAAGLVCAFSAMPVLSAGNNELVILTTFSSEPLTPLVEAFNQTYPNVAVKVLHRRTSSSIQMLNKTYIGDVDILLSSSPYLMTHLLNAGKLSALPARHTAPVWLQPYVLPKSDKVLTIGYSGAGVVWNKDYLQSHDLPEPGGFVSLADPVYFGHITMSTPARSGTTQMMLASVLEAYGWDQGWRHMLNIAANFATVSSRSFGVADSIAKGSLGLGPTIDSYAHNLQRKYDYIGFDYDQEFTLMPTYIGILNQHDPYANAFVEMMMSDASQQRMADNSFSKYSLIDSALAEKQHISLDIDALMAQELGVNLLFDLAITNRLPELNDAWLALLNAYKRAGDSTAPSQALREAKALMFSLPVSKTEFSEKTARLTALSSAGDEQSQAAFAAEKEEWLHDIKHRLADNLDKALTLIEQSNQNDQF